MRKKFSFILVSALALALGACMYDPNPPEPRQFSVSGITLDRTSLALNLWTAEDYDYSTAVLAVKTLPEAVHFALVWGSSNNNVARVANGLVTAVSEGSAVITVSAKNGSCMASCSVLVVNLAPGPVEAVNIADMTLYLGGTNQKTLTPEFTPVFVTNETVSWSSGTPAVAAINQRGVVSAVAAGTAVITVITADGSFSNTCTVTVTPLLAQFGSVAAFLQAGSTYFKPGFDFGTDPAANGDAASNTSTWTGTDTNQTDFVLNYTYNYTKFGKAGTGNLVPQFVHQKNGADYVPSGDIAAGPYRSHTQYNYAAIAHYAFTGFRQAHPWGINSLTPAPSDGSGTTRAGQTWSAGINAYTANTNTVQYSGIGVDLGNDTYIDTVMIYAGGGINPGGDADNATGTFNSTDINTKCLGLTLEYMPDAAANAVVFNNLYKANLFSEPTNNWNSLTSANNWPAPGYPGSPWISGGKIVPNGSSWVYVFYFEQPVLARFLRCNFEQAPVVPPATGFLGRAFVNSFEVYNTRN